MKPSVVTLSRHVADLPLSVAQESSLWLVQQKLLALPTFQPGFKPRAAKGNRGGGHKCAHAAIHCLGAPWSRMLGCLRAAALQFLARIESCFQAPTLGLFPKR